MSNLGGDAEAYSRFKKYEYRANSSLILTIDSRPRDTHEPTREPESLYGKIDPKSFGDRVARGRPPELDEKLKKSSKRKKERELLSEQASSTNGDGLDNEVGVAVEFEENDDDDDDDSDLGSVQDEEEEDEDLAEACSSEESKDFTKFNLEELAGSLITHELHLGTTDSSRNNGLALTAADQEESECDEEEAANTDQFIKDCPMWKNEKGKEKAREIGRLPTKRNLNKTDFCKAMIAVWGESESDAEIENPEEEEKTNLCLMASHESKNEKSKGKEVKSSNLFPNHLFKLNRYKLIELLMEAHDKLKESNDKCLQLLDSGSDTRDTVLEGIRKGNTYVVDINTVPNSSLTCLSVIEEDPLLWHKHDEDLTKEQNQRTVGEQLIQEQTKVPDETEQQVNEDQQAVPNPSFLKNEQTDPVEAE
ncbi:uncharacterized protein LOC130821570 [Amaranthus tricolor]|uniref:uncharacterized protein LOC130821570 n=1 Tax=Amaranthus tricolor TaxID=29722 RepID=UPI0025850BFD|nr:uncharacterized protein LOC130821570 [Amaranthus tricolor]